MLAEAVLDVAKDDDASVDVALDVAKDANALAAMDEF
jgi:hypothetical protein